MKILLKQRTKKKISFLIVMYLKKETVSMLKEIIPVILDHFPQRAAKANHLQRIKQ